LKSIERAETLGRFAKLGRETRRKNAKLRFEIAPRTPNVITRESG
jgi:hypothetical protein